MRRSVLRLTLLLCTLVLLCSALSLGAAADTEEKASVSASELISDGGFYRISNKTADGYITLGESGISVLDRDGAENIFEINATSEGFYTIRAIVKGDAGYLCLISDGTGKGELALTDDKDSENASFDIRYNGERFTIKAAYAENTLSLCAIKGAGDVYSPAFAEEAGDLSLWKISEYKPESFTLSLYSIRTKPYTSYNDLKAVVSPSYMAEYVRWDSTERSVLLVDGDGKFCALAEGDSTVIASIGNCEVKCKVNVSYDNEYAWFSQNNVETGGWNGSALYNIKFRSGGITKRFGFNGSTKFNDWLSEGCAICSIAQVFSNMGARLTNGYDFRSGLEGNLMADPYTVALANSNNYGPTSSSAVLRGDPILAKYTTIAAKFNVNGKKIKVTLTTNVTKKTIKEALDNNPWGVVVGFENAAYGTHFVTFNKCINPDAKNWRDYEFLISDPVSMNRYDSDNVLFEDSYSYKRLYYRFSNADKMLIWSIEE